MLGVTVSQLMDESIYNDEKCNKDVRYSEDSYDVGLMQAAEKRPCL